jgi:FlaA1/EpsC-like NDP-sugar epimerase
VIPLKYRRILITGGTGTWGQELVRQLLEYHKCENITVMARNEANLVEMSRKFPEVAYVMGDVRDYEKVYNVLKYIDLVFHMAAVKHVPICESQPEEAINTNILGTMNIVKACQRREIKDAVLISTDKAVEPVNTYGISKAMAEKLFLNAHFKVIRAGNVIGSSGSVIPLFRKQLDNNETVTLTNSHMTRFFMLLPRAIKLVLEACEICRPAEIAIVGMPSYRLVDVIDVLAEGKEYEIEIIGIRDGEKLHEVLVAEGELLNTYYMPGKNLYIISHYPDYEWVQIEGQYSSENYKTDLEELKTLLKFAGYLNS